MTDSNYFPVLNEFQTAIDDAFLADMPQEVKEQFFSLLNSVEYIGWLINKDRPRAKDMEHDAEGRVIVDIAHPHILEDMDYFRPSALHFQKHGCFTELRPNPNPNSAFYKWFIEEKRRCYEGYVRKKDGEWVTGYMYWFINYCPIMLTKMQAGSKHGSRVEDFPEVWEGIYLRFHYLEQARWGGKYNNWTGGQHSAELASRGKGKSFSLGAILSHDFVIGESMSASKKVTDVVTAYQKEFLIKDGVVNKFLSMTDFVAENTQFPRIRLKDSMQEMQWQMGYKDQETGIVKGSQNTILGVSSKDDSSKLRGKRCAHVLIEEFGTFPKLADLYNNLIPSVQEGEICFGQIYMLGTAGDDESDFAGASEIMYNPKGYNMYAVPNVYDKTNSGRPNFVYFFPGYINRKGCYNKDGVSDVTLALKQILMNRYTVKYNSSDPKTIIKTMAEIPITPAEAIVKSNFNMFPVTDLSSRLGQLDANESEFDSVYVGEIELSKNGTPMFRPSNAEVIRNFPHKNNKNMQGAVEIYTMPETDRDNRVFGNRYVLGCLTENELVNTDRGLVKVQDVLPSDKLINKEGDAVSIKNFQVRRVKEPVRKIYMSNLIDPVMLTRNHPVYASSPEVKYYGVEKVRRGCPERYWKMKFGFKPAGELKVSDVVKTPNIYNKEKPFMHHWSSNESDLNPLGMPDFWWLLGEIAGNGWASKDGRSVCISFNRNHVSYIKKATRTIERGLGRKVYAIRKGINCTEIRFSHKVLNSFIADNIGRGAKNKFLAEWIKFIPARFKRQLILGYLASDGCVSSRNVEFVSVSKKLLKDFQDIFFSIGCVTNLSLLRSIGEMALMGRLYKTLPTYHLRGGAKVLNEMKSWVRSDHKLDSYKTVELANHSRKKCWFDKGCRYIYFLIDRIEEVDYKGKVYNFECETHSYVCNYLPTHNCDPYDDDESNTVSLGSVFVLDLWTDRLVAEYTGRPPFADDFFEICRRLALFYNGRINYENNKKGMFAYFSRNNCLHLLTDVLDFLKDKQMMRDGFGNKSKGTVATMPINSYARTLLNAWLRKPVEVTEVDDNGEEKTRSIPNLFSIKSRAFIQELINYNDVGNFDRVSAMGMLMLLREDRLILCSGNIKNEDSRMPIENDKFFANFDSIKLKRNSENSFPQNPYLL